MRIDSLYCWIVVHENGAEAIATVGSLSLVSSSYALARDLMQRAAEKVLERSKESANPGVRIVLREFDRYEPDGRG